MGHSPLFFGILRNIQDEMDEAEYEEYCRRRYEYVQALQREREKKEQMRDKPTAEGLASMLKNAVLTRVASLSKLLVKQARLMAESLKKEYRYLGVLRKKVLQALSEVTQVTVDQLKKATALLDKILA